MIISSVARGDSCSSEWVTYFWISLCPLTTEVLEGMGACTSREVSSSLASLAQDGVDVAHGLGSSLGRRTATRGGDGGGVEWRRVAVVEQHAGEALLGVDVLQGMEACTSREVSSSLAQNGVDVVHGVGSSLDHRTAARGNNGGGVEWRRVALVEQHAGQSPLRADSERR